MKATKAAKSRTRTVGYVRSAKKPRKRIASSDVRPKKSAPSEPGGESLLPPCTVAEAAAVVDSMRAAGWKPEPATPEHVYLFENDRVSPKAPLTKLLAAMFEATNAPDFRDPAKSIMANVLCSIADECDLLNGLNNGMDNGTLIERVTFRLNYRAHMAVELARRIEAGEVKS